MSSVHTRGCQTRSLFLATRSVESSNEASTVRTKHSKMSARLLPGQKPARGGLQVAERGDAPPAIPHTIVSHPQFVGYPNGYCLPAFGPSSVHLLILTQDGNAGGCCREYNGAGGCRGRGCLWCCVVLRTRDCALAEPLAGLGSWDAARRGQPRAPLVSGA